MTMMIQTTRKQIGSFVAFGGKSAQVRTGMNQGQAEPLGDPTSLARHLSLSDPDSSEPRPERAYPGAMRTGRSESSAGVLSRVGLARFAGRTIPLGGSTTGKPCQSCSFVQQPEHGFASRPTATLAGFLAVASLGSWSMSGNLRISEIMPVGYTRRGE
jgi:hypothetical protein